MDLPVIRYQREEFVETASGNKVYRMMPGRPSRLCGTQNIVLTGKCVIKPDVVIRGDLSAVRMGRYCIIEERSVLRPSHKRFSKGVTMFPVHIGDFVMVEEDCIVNAAQIGSYVHIGAGSIIGRSTIIKECCRVLPGSVIAPDSVFPSFSTIAGNPAVVIGKEPECTEKLMEQATRQYFDNFLPHDANRVPLS